MKLATDLQIFVRVGGGALAKEFIIKYTGCVQLYGCLILYPSWMDLMFSLIMSNI